MIIKAAKRIFNSDKICRSYGDLNFGVTFLEHSVDVSVIELGSVDLVKAMIFSQYIRLIEEILLKLY